MGAYALPKIQSPEDPVEQDTRIASLKSLLAQQKMQPGQLELQKQAIDSGKMQNQQQQLDMDSQKAIMRGYTEANGDVDKAEGLAAQYGAKPADLIKLRQAGVDQKMKALEYVKAKGAQALQEADLVSGMQDTVSAAPPEQRAQIYQQQLQGLQKAGVDISHMPPQYPGDQGFQIIGAAVRGHKQLVEDAFKQSEKAKNEAQARNANADADKTTLETDQLKQFGGMSAGAADAKYRSIIQRQKLGNAISPEDQAYVGAYEKQKTLVPAFKIQQGAEKRNMEEQAIETAAQSLANGDLTRLKDIASLRGDQRLFIYNRAKELNPKFNTADIDRKIKMEDSFTNGKDGQNLQSFGTFLEHAGAASDQVNAFRASGSPAINKPINWWKKNMSGDPAFQAYIASLEPVRKEFEGFLLGGRALYGDDRKAAETILSDDASPAQQQAALKQMGHTASARINESNFRYKRTMGHDLQDVISPEALEGAKRIGVEIKVGNSTPSAPDGKPSLSSFERKK